jgi:hypothetical protein
LKVSIFAFILPLLCASAQAQFAPFKLQVKRFSGDEASLRQDLRQILAQSTLSSESIDFSWVPAKGSENTVSMTCSTTLEKKLRVGLKISASNEERVSTFYYGLQKLGFLFPHPRLQISPSEGQMRKACGQSYQWKPRFAYRGFHLHTLHPSEWVHGFFMNKPQIAEETIRWSARNGQNILQAVLLEQNLEDIERQLIPLVRLANNLGISFGIDLSVESIQQRMGRLVSPESKFRLLYLILFRQYETKEKDIEESLHKLLEKLPFDFMTLELGTSEFTPSNYKLTIERLNKADDILRAGGKRLYIKIHSSINQIHPEFGNFNFIPSFTQPTVGVLPHTLMFYGMTDLEAPVYGRKDFKDLLQFTAREAKIRPVWYFPETSYYIAMDIDVPLFLTDFLLVRSEDMRELEKLGVEGHLNFTTGQELGYWLFDWNVALLANSEFKSEDAPALRLLGEDVLAWKKIIDYQHKYFKILHLLEELSSSNLLDELPLFSERTIARRLLQEIKNEPVILKSKIDLLRQAISDAPDLSLVKNPELKALLEITQARLRHALFLRQALLAESEHGRDSRQFNDYLEEARRVRLDALKLMTDFIKQYERYPEAQIFSRQQNLTSYEFGYGWTAGKLHFWEREEEMIRQNSYKPWFMQIINPLKIIF